jgi:hypothetical protein
MRNKLITLFLLLLCISVNAQKNQISFLVGNRTGEISFLRADKFIYGLAIGITDSKMLEKQLIIKVPFKIEIEDNPRHVPTLFVVLGKSVGKCSVMLKSGFVYVDLLSDGKPNNPKFHYAGGMAIGYDVTNKIGVKISSDNIAKLMVGLTVRI